MIDRLLVATTFLTAATGLLPCGAQEVQPAQNTFPPPPRPVRVYLETSPTVLLLFDGDRGRTQLAGRLISPPDEPLILADRSGERMNVKWSEVAALERVLTASEAAPYGSYRVRLVRNMQPEGNYEAGVGLPDQGRRLLQAPPGPLVLESDLFGKMTIPASRIRGLTRLPIGETVESLPDVAIKVELFPGQTISVPLDAVTYYRRDRRDDSVYILLRDQQVVTGRLLDLPQISIPLDSTRMPRSVDLRDVAVLEIRQPPGSVSLGVP